MSRGLQLSMSPPHAFFWPCGASTLGWSWAPFPRVAHSQHILKAGLFAIKSASKEERDLTFLCWPFNLPGNTNAACNYVSFPHFTLFMYSIQAGPQKSEMVSLLVVIFTAPGAARPSLKWPSRIEERAHQRLRCKPDGKGWAASQETVNRVRSSRATNTVSIMSGGVTQKQPSI